MPRDLQTIFYSTDVSLDDLTNQLTEMEQFRKKNPKRISSQKYTDATTTVDKVIKQDIKCYACGEKGHIKPDRLKKKVNRILPEKTKYIDQRLIYLDNINLEAIFDAGARMNLYAEAH